MKIGFIGLGRMGSAMARNLMRAGHAVTVYNRSRGKAEAFAAEGARAAGSPAEACQESEAVFTMLSDDQALEEVVSGENGIAGALASGSVHISSSTIGAAMARRVAAIHAARGQGFLSAPVFERPETAETKKLIVVAAGDPALVDRCRPLFEAIGRETCVAGREPWQANALKLCGNFMIASLLETFGEAFATMRKAGVDHRVFLDAMNALFASPVYANYGRILVNEQFEPAAFALKLGLKDMGLVLETARECGSPMPLASLIRDHLISAAANGQSEMDWSSITRVSARAAGFTMSPAPE